MGEDRTDDHRVGRGKDRLTIAEAATFLGVHKNTVRNRIKNGTYRAELVQTERGPTYLIERDSLLTSLTTNTISSASQDVVSPQAMEFVQELLRPFVSELGEVREELGVERARRQVAEERVADLEAELGASAEAAKPSGHPSVLRESWEEGAKEVARRFVVAVFGLVVAIPASLTAVISYFNNAPTQAILAALVVVFGMLTAVVGVWFGIKASADASDEAQRSLAEANTSAKRATKGVQEERREGD